MQIGPWICDRCKTPIESIDNVYVEWLRKDDPKPGETSEFGIKLIHNTDSPLLAPRGCHYDEEQVYRKDNTVVQSLNGDSLIGSDGLMELLMFIQEGELEKTEVIELIKRLHIPNYEQARPYIDEAVSIGEIETNMLEGFYTQEQLINAINWGKQKDDEY